MFRFLHERAGLDFFWDGWMRIRVRSGRFAPRYLFPDSFDIREPDLRGPSRHPDYPGDQSIHFVPQTQQAFEALCNSWWRGDEVCVGGRDYNEYPWERRSWGMTQGAFRFRYVGGTHVEASPGEVQTWYPIIDLAMHDRTSQSLSTTWLINRTHGWELAWLAAQGINGRGDRIDHTAIVRWTTENLPAPGPKGSLSAQFGLWVTQQAIDTFTGLAWTQFRDIGRHDRRVNDDWPWSATRDDTSGNRWNFWWRGGNCAYVYSPDRALTYEQSEFLRVGDDLAHDTVIDDLERRVDPWIANL